MKNRLAVAFAILSALALGVVLAQIGKQVKGTVAQTSSTIVMARVAKAKATGRSSSLTVAGLNGNVDGEYEVKVFLGLQGQGYYTYYLCFQDITTRRVLGGYWADWVGTPVGGSSVGTRNSNSINGAGFNASTCIVLGEWRYDGAPQDRSICVEHLYVANGQARLVEGQCFDGDQGATAGSGGHMQIHGGQLYDTTTNITQLTLQSIGPSAPNLTPDTWLEVWAPRAVP